jgi:hypothetical protein
VAPGATRAAGAPLSLATRVRAHPTTRRLALLASVLGSFALGAALGTLAYGGLPTVLPGWGLERFAMFPPVLFLVWLVYVDAVSPVAEIEPSRLAGDATLDLPAGLGLYRLKRDDARAGRGPARFGARARGREFHRLPDLLLWADRLPREKRVVILDLSDAVEIDDDAAAQFRAVLERFRREGREMVLTGLTTAQWRALRRAAGATASPSGDQGRGTPEGGLDADSLCPDVELAIARGLNLLARTGEPLRG